MHIDPASLLHLGNRIVVASVSGGKDSTAPALSLRAFVAEHHRHLGPPVSGLFAVGVARGGELVGAAIVGRPVARELQDGDTAEITRVCTLGDRNACTMLLSACRRGAAALGYRRVVTYTLSSEPGTSLRAAGWQETAQVRGRSWNCASRPRTESTPRNKRRWEAPLSKRSERGADVDTPRVSRPDEAFFV